MPQAAGSAAQLKTVSWELGEPRNAAGPAVQITPILKVEKAHTFWKGSEIKAKAYGKLFGICEVCLCQVKY